LLDSNFQNLAYFLANAIEVEAGGTPTARYQKIFET
jgi:hypothetical protein